MAEPLKQDHSERKMHRPLFQEIWSTEFPFIARSQQLEGIAHCKACATNDGATVCRCKQQTRFLRWGRKISKPQDRESNERTSIQCDEDRDRRDVLCDSCISLYYCVFNIGVCLNIVHTCVGCP